MSTVAFEIISPMANVLKCDFSLQNPRYRRRNSHQL